MTLFVMLLLFTGCKDDKRDCPRLCCRGDLPTGVVAGQHDQAKVTGMRMTLCQY